MTKSPTGHARRALLASAEAAAAREAFDALLALSYEPVLLVETTTGAVLRANDAAWQVLEATPGTDATLVLRRPSRVGTDEGPAVRDGRQRLIVGETYHLVDLEVVPLRDAGGDEPTALVRLRVDTSPEVMEGPAVELLRETAAVLTSEVGLDLTMVGGHVEVLTRDVTAASRVRSAEAARLHVGRAREGVTAALARIRALLGGEGPTDVRELVRVVRGLLAERLADARHDVVLVDGKVVLADVDADLLRQVLMNLLLELTSDEHAPPRRVRVVVARGADGVDVQLSHDGAPVLPAAARSLDVSRQLLREAGGDLVATGTTADIRLPERATDEPGPTPVDVVVIDDDPDLVHLVDRLLSAGTNRYRFIGSANTLAAAETVLRDVQPRVVLLDQDLPDGVGTDVLPRLRAIAPASTFVVLSAHEPTDWKLAEGVAQLQWLDKYRALATLPAMLDDALELG